GDHFFYAFWFLWHIENDVQRHLAHFVRQRKSVSSGFGGADLARIRRILHLLCRGSRIHHALHHALLDQWHALAPHSLAIERRTGLQRMRGVIPDVDVFPKQPGADPVVQKRTLVENRDAAVVPEHEANNI